MFRIVLTFLLCLALPLGCSNDTTESSTNNATNSPSNQQNENSVACLLCGPAVACGETCNDECGCCCDDGDERAQNGGLERCTGGCWARVGVAVDMGTTSDSGSDLGRDAGPDAAPDMPAAACTKTPNGQDAPIDTCQHGAAEWLAWQWVPDEDMTVASILMHTDDGNGAFLADDATRPGAVLAEGVLSAADADGWRTLSFAVPIAVTAGTTYWIGEDVLTCSTAENGTEFTYFTADSTAGPWSGPFNAHPFTARITGTCP